MAFVDKDYSTEFLYVATSIFNPEGKEIRYKLYRDFKNYISKFTNVILVTIEVAFKDQPFKVTSPYNPCNIQLRTDDILWLKENTLNIIFKMLPKNAKVAWIDADIEFENKNWVDDTLNALNIFKFVQLFEECKSLGPKNEILSTDPGFACLWNLGIDKPNRRGRSGLAWASTVETLKKIGWLADWDIVGASDWFHAFAVTNQEHKTNNPCRKKNERWASLVKEHVNGNVSYIEGSIKHFFHGYPSDRGYNTRGKILVDNDFDPDVDIGYREDGLLYFTSNKPKLRHDIFEYFKSTKIHGAEDVLV